MKNRKPNGYELWQGASLINNSPIVAIVTGTSRKSRNIKTGPILQLWILCANENPLSALASGGDIAICGNCKHRLMRTCYVDCSKSPANIYKAWKRGVYPKIDIRFQAGLMKNVFGNKSVRLGAYGDPSCIPDYILERISLFAKNVLGYTHHWRNNVALNRYCMASCETLSESKRAIDAGFKVFLTLQNKDKVPANFIKCPASNNHKTTCEKCKNCSGQNSKARNIYIRVHGTRYKKVFFARGMKAKLAKKKFSLVS